MIFPYRWMWRTVHRNINSLFLWIVDGIRNVVKWTPVIWDDFDYDWEPLARIMEFKLRNMSENFSGTDITCCDETAKETLICAELLKRLMADDSSGVGIHRHMARSNGWEEMLGEIIGKKLRNWWI